MSTFVSRISGIHGWHKATFANQASWHLYGDTRGGITLGGPVLLARFFESFWAGGCWVIYQIVAPNSKFKAGRGRATKSAKTRGRECSFAENSIPEIDFLIAHWGHRLCSPDQS